MHPGFTNDDVVGTHLVTVSAEGRVEHQKLNQTTPYGAVWLSFWCSTRPSADTVTKSVPTTSSLVKPGCTAIAKYIRLYDII